MPEAPAGGRKEDESSSVGRGPVGPAVIVICSVVFTVLGILLLYALWKFFPDALPAGGVAPATNDYKFLWGTFTLTPEKDLLVTVALAGAVGAMAYVLRSFFKYVGERLLRNSWLLSYFLIPLVGAIMATIVYLVIRGGLIAGGGIDQTNPFGFAAVAVLVGLFSAQAAEKLKQVFETLFATAPPGKDPIPTEVKDKPPAGGAPPALVPAPAASVVVVVPPDPVPPQPPDSGDKASAGGDN